MQSSHGIFVDLPIGEDPLEAAHAYFKARGESYVIESINYVMPGEKNVEF
jgi:hypothetical protein